MFFDSAPEIPLIDRLLFIPWLDEFSNFRSVRSSSPVELTERPSAPKTLRELGGVLIGPDPKFIELKLFLLFIIGLSSSSI